jgi:hypothetical protein
MHLHPLQYLVTGIFHSLALKNTLISATKVINNPNECGLSTQNVTATEVMVASVAIKGLCNMQNESLHLVHLFFSYCH